MVTGKVKRCPFGLRRVPRIYREAVKHLGIAFTNDFYHFLGQGTLAAAAHYGGCEFACVLGQEMAGYATGEVFFASQPTDFDTLTSTAQGYSYDQKAGDKKAEDAVAFLSKRSGGGCSSRAWSRVFLLGVYIPNVCRSVLPLWVFPG